jgi:hypothetical protein
VPAEASATTQHADGSMVVHELDEVLGFSPGKQMCEVSVGSGITLNTGNYTAVRHDVRIMIPCEIGEQDVIYDFAKDWVDDRLSKMVTDTKAEFQLK